MGKRTLGIFGPLAIAIIVPKYVGILKKTFWAVYKLLFYLLIARGGSLEP